MRKFSCLSVFVVLAVMTFAYSRQPFAFNLTDGTIPGSVKKSPFGDKKNMALLIVDVGDANYCTTLDNGKCIKYKAIKGAYVSIDAFVLQPGSFSSFDLQVAKGWTDSQGTFSAMLEKGNSYKITVSKNGHENAVAIKSVYQGKPPLHPLYKNTFNVLVGLKAIGAGEDCSKGWQSLEFDALQDAAIVYALGKFDGMIHVGTDADYSIKFVESNPSEWTTVKLPSSDANISVFASSSNNIYAGGAAGIYIHMPEQNIWQMISKLPLEFKGGIPAMALYKDIPFMANTNVKGLYWWDTDNSTWKKFDYPHPIHTLLAYDNFLYAGTNGGVLRLENILTDGTWQDGTWQTGLTLVGTWKEDFGDFPATLAVFKEKLYAGSACCFPDNTGVYRYDQDSDKWAHVLEGVVTSLAVSDDMIFAIVKKTTGETLIYKSTSGESGSWKEIEPSPPTGLNESSIFAGKYLYVTTAGKSISRIPLGCIQ